VHWAAALASRAARRQATLSDQRPGAAAIACCKVAPSALRWGSSKGRSRAGPELIARLASVAEARCVTWPSMPCAPGTQTPLSLTKSC
jgi:hypothetical protein